MIVLGTNVVSEVMKPSPKPSVVEWLNQQETATLYLSTITLAEIGYGLRILPDGKRRRTLEDRFDRFIEDGFAHRVLGFDVAAARLYGEVMVHRKALGRPLSILDGQIASIARANDSTVATRNVDDFEDCGLSLTNPFEEGGSTQFGPEIIGSREDAAHGVDGLLKEGPRTRARRNS